MKNIGLLIGAFFVGILCVNAQNATNKSVKPKMAIEYFAEFNLAAPQQFGESHARDEGYLFRGTEARFTSARKKVCPNGYHLPSIEEWRGIVGEIPSTDRWKNTGIGYIPFNRSDFMAGPVLWDIEETIQVGLNEPAKNYLSDYYIVGETKSSTKFVIYALRFKKDDKSATDNKMLTAYRYALLGMQVSASIKRLNPPPPYYLLNNYEPGPAFRLQVTARYLGEEFQGSINDIANEEYWNNNKASDVTRFFPGGEAPHLSYTDMGIYWSSSEDYEGMRYFNFTKGGLGTKGALSPNFQAFVRCVSDK